MRVSFRFAGPLTVLVLAWACAPAPPSERAASARQRQTISQSGSVLMQRYDKERSGANLGETSLTVPNVGGGRFGKLFARSVDGFLYAQPLYVPSLAVAGKGVHNAIVAATEHNTVYAFDADDPGAQEPLWAVNLGPSMPSDDIRSEDPAAADFRCHDLTPEVGITSTPVIDPESGTLYVAAKTKDGDAAYAYRLHALDLASGAEREGSPVTIAATVPGAGYVGRDTPNTGTITFDAYRQLNRPALLLWKGAVYLAFGSHCDLPPYFGWVIGYDARSLTQIGAYADTANGWGGGIWQAGGGLAADDAGIYLMSGNGDSDVSRGDLASAFVKLERTERGIEATDYFMPANAQQLNDEDLDLGSSGVLLVPGTNMVLGGGKEGVFYLLDRANLGKVSPDDAQVVQRFAAAKGHIHGSPTFWQGPDAARMYVWSENDDLLAFTFDGQRFDTNPTRSALDIVYGMPGGMLSISANGAAPGSGVLWASHPFDRDANQQTVTGILRAFDATDVTHEIWNSKMNAGRDDVGDFAKFVAPTVANGKVYLATFSGALNVYGVLPSGACDGVAPATQLASNPGATALDGQPVEGVCIASVYYCSERGPAGQVAPDGYASVGSDPGGCDYNGCNGTACQQNFCKSCEGDCEGRCK